MINVIFSVLTIGVYEGGGCQPDETRLVLVSSIRGPELQQPKQSMASLKFNPKSFAIMDVKSVYCVIGVNNIHMAPAFI